MTWLYPVYIIVAVYELYLFLMQRSSLEISRAYQVDQKTGRYMLPLWYATVWPTMAVKWALLIAIYWTDGPIVAVVLWAISFAVSMVIPVPHRHFLPMFNRTVTKLFTTNPNVAAVLRTVLAATEAGYKTK